MTDDDRDLRTPTDPDSGESIVRRLAGRTERRADDGEISTPNHRGAGGLARDPAALARAADLISTPSDKHLSALPREASARATGKGPRRPAIWNSHETVDAAPTPVYGAFPKRFVTWAIRQLGSTPREVLHICSGMLTRGDVGGGLRVDVRRSACPDVLADARALPFVDAAFGGALIDPPYSVECARDLYGTDYPRPAHILAEAARVVRPGGRIGLLHFLVPTPPPRCRIVSVTGITQGCGYRIRAFTLLEREQDGLDL